MIRLVYSTVNGYVARRGCVRRLARGGFGRKVGAVTKQNAYE